jgi:hypothetical protein
VFDKAKNSKIQGDIGLGAAIGWFTKEGYTVSIPLTDSQDYDMVVDDGDGPKRVQVKTTTQRQKLGGYQVELRTLGGNQSWSGTVKYFNRHRIDYLFILTDDGRQFFIPSEVVPTRSINVGGKSYLDYEIK